MILSSWRHGYISDLGTKQRTHFVARNILTSIGSPAISPFMTASEWHVAMANFITDDLIVSTADSSSKNLHKTQKKIC